MFNRRLAHSARYKAHIASPEWRRIREAALARAGYRCAFCGRGKAPGRPLQVHHNTYANLGHERPEDLTVLCAGKGGCHAAADKQRRAGAGQTRKPTRHRRRRRRRMSKPLRAFLSPIGLFFVAAGGLKLAAILLPHT
jgi:5-methylcytosine-specific restriction endonuclease McrA